ncbi:hypothetical protein AAG906_040314 [Vitis piasezkii]
MLEQLKDGENNSSDFMVILIFQFHFKTPRIPLLLCCCIWWQWLLLIPSQWRIDSLFEMTMKASIQTLESGLPASLHKDVQTDAPEYLKGCSNNDERCDMWPNRKNATWIDTWKYSWVDTFYWAHHIRMASRGDDASTNAASKDKKNVRPREVVGRTESRKSIEQLNVWEFRECFRTPIGISIRWLSGDPHFNFRLQFPFLSLFKQFLHFTKIPPVFLHPNIVRVLMGCSILSMLYHLDLSLLEVLFIYTIKMSGKEIFSLSAHIPFLQLVTRLPDSTKRATKGCVVVSGPCHLATSSTACPLPKKKSVLRPAKKTLDLSPPSSSHSFPSSSIEVGVDQGSSGSPSIGVSSDQEIEPTVPFIDLELEEEEETEDMAPNMRVGFKERQHKRISEALLATLSSVKKSQLIVGPPSDDACSVGDEVPTVLRHK